MMTWHLGMCCQRASCTGQLSLRCCTRLSAQVQAWLQGCLELAVVSEPLQVVWN
jgi:hypothetical protein